MPDLIHSRLEDVRRYGTELVSSLGTPPPRAAAMTSHLLWFDAAGATTFGIATLPRWLARIEAGEFDTVAEGHVTTERNGTAVLDGQNGLPPLILGRGAGLAVEKAREAGVGLVRVVGIGPTGPAAVLAAEMAIGPFSALILGPGPSASLAIPSDVGLPAVFDSDLAVAASPTPAVLAAGPTWSGGLAPWLSLLTTGGGWLIAAVAVNAWEPLPALHARVKEMLGDQPEMPGQLLPSAWETHRRALRDEGVPVPADVREELARWSERLGVAPLPPSRSPSPTRR